MENGLDSAVIREISGSYRVKGFPQIKKIYAEQMNGDNPTLRASRFFSLRTLRLKLITPVSHARLNGRAGMHGKHGEWYFNAVSLVVKKTG